MSILSNYSDKEFERIVLTSNNYRDCLRNLGYQSFSGSTVNLIKNRIQQLKISTDHFTAAPRTERTEANIFIKDSTADQTVLRKWYKRGNYTEYKCSICGQEPYWNGKELTLILDHINGYNHDDRLENLRWVCPNCNYQLDTTNGKNQQHGNHTINHCIDCGQPISKKSVRCLSCSQKIRKNNIVAQVGRDELKELIRTTPFTTIGKKFKVTDNAIRKWCDKYQLPRKTSEIKKISDKDWGKI